MLQLKALNDAALAALVPQDGIPKQWDTMSELEKAADSWIDRLRSERTRIARWRRGWPRLMEWLDRRIRTDASEHLDQPDFPEESKLAMVRSLHRMNILLRSYRDFVRILAPLCAEVARREGRPARLLELASGSGEFTLALSALAVKRGLPMEITGSDCQALYVASARKAAEARGLPARFRLVNAFAMQDVAAGSYDIVFVSQSMHHFTPGQLAMMIAQSRALATTAFVGVDGYRSIALLFAVPGLAALSLRPSFVHDALITARRLYSAAELRLIGRIAAPGALTQVNRHRFGFSVLRVHWQQHSAAGRK